MSTSATPVVLGRSNHSLRISSMSQVDTVSVERLVDFTLSVPDLVPSTSIWGLAC